MALNRTFTLNTGAKIPAVGFGTWQAAPNEVERAVETALRAGYKHIDCAAIYRNEAEVGRGIQKSGVPRSEIFITTKLWNTKHDPSEVEGALDKSLADLGVDYVDLYLMHWPCAFASGEKWFPLSEKGVFQLSSTSFTETYAAMEKLLATGKTKAIGVSNFTVENLKKLLATCTVRPAVNQIEAHPYLQQSALFNFCKEQGIQVTAYSPLGNNQQNLPKAVDDGKIISLAQSLDITPAQLLISWAVQRGTVVLPKSVTESRIKSNFQDVVLDEKTMENVSALERNKRFNFPARWGSDIFGECGQEEVRRIALESADENLVKFTV